MGVRIELRSSRGAAVSTSPGHVDTERESVALTVASPSRTIDTPDVLHSNDGAKNVTTTRCNDGDKSVLEDILADDLRDLGDYDVMSEGETGRWEDTCKKCISDGETYPEVDLLDWKVNSKVVLKKSPETPRENASILDSSLTWTKHDAENHDDRGSSGSKESKPCQNFQDEDQEDHSFVGTNSENDVEVKKQKFTRYFIIKSLSHRNIELSVEKGIWATQVMNEPILEDAFHNSDRVILIFSVNTSGYFQGYAQMMSGAGWRRDSVWTESSSGGNPWGRTFKVKWLQLRNLPFQKTLHLKNPLNDCKPVKISRDCQELTQDVGKALCGLIDAMDDFDGKLKRVNSYEEHSVGKRSCWTPPTSLSEDNYVGGFPVPQTAWMNAPMSYPLYPYQHMMLAQSQPQLSPGTSSGDFAEAYTSSSQVWKGSRLSHHPIHKPVRGRKGSSTRSDLMSGAGGADSVSEDDILDMSYEEYLQVCGRSKDTDHHGRSRVV